MIQTGRKKNDTKGGRNMNEPFFFRKIKSVMFLGKKGTINWWIIFYYRYTCIKKINP